MPASTAIVAYTWIHAEAGTPPFQCAFNLTSTDDVPTDNAADMVENFADAFNSNLLPIFWSGLQTGSCVVTVESSLGETSADAGLDIPTGSEETPMPGTSYRVILEAPRPPKGRANAMYFPLPDGGHVNVEGVVDDAAKTAIAAWGEAVLTYVATTDWEWDAIHQIGGPTAEKFYVPVSGVHSAPTASFLRRRYR
jgi:hypothetical protein